MTKNEAIDFILDKTAGWPAVAREFWTRFTYADRQLISFFRDADTSVATLENKTLDGPVIADGLTASGSADNDFSGSTGGFKTPTGKTTVNGAFNMGAAQALSGTGALTAVNLTDFTTTIATVGGAATTTLAAGAEGDVKQLVMITDGGDAVVTVTNLQGGTTLTFAEVGDLITLTYRNSKWTVVSNSGVVLA